MKWCEVLGESPDKTSRLIGQTITWTKSQKVNAQLAAQALVTAGFKAMTENPSGSKVSSKFAAIGSPTNGILVNPRSPYWKDPVGNARFQFSSGHLSTDNPMGILLHEIAHTIFDVTPNWLSEKQKEIAKQVSRYAGVNPREFVSEVFAGIHTGKTYGEDVMRLYGLLSGRTYQ